MLDHGFVTASGAWNASIVAEYLHFCGQPISITGLRPPPRAAAWLGGAETNSWKGRSENVKNGRELGSCCRLLFIVLNLLDRQIQRWLWILGIGLPLNACGRDEGGK